MIAKTLNLYKNAYAGLTKKIWLLSTVMLINRCGTMVLAFMTLYSSHLGFSIKQGGLVVAIYGIGSIVGAFLGGKISDKFGFYYTQFSALFFGGLLFIVLGLMKNYTSICVVTFCLSMVNESFRPANATAIAHYSTEQNRSQSFSLIRLAINLGWAVGSALGGFLAAINYHLLFWVDGVTNIAAAFLLLIILPKVTKQQQHTPVNKDEISPKKSSAYGDKKFLIFLGFMVLFAACFFQIFTSLPLYFKKVLHLSEFTIGSLLAFSGIIIVLFEMVFVYKMEGKKPYLTFMAIGALIMGVAYLFLLIPTSFTLIIAALVIFFITLGEMASMPFMNSFYIARSTQLTRGQYAGLYTMAWSTAQVIGSGAGAIFAEQYGFNNLWVLVSISCIIVASGWYWLQSKEFI